MRELAERAVACKHWRWMAGMWTFNPNMPNLWYQRVGLERTPQHRFLLPRLSDPATLGCVMALVREAYANAVVITQGNGWWSVETDHHFWDQDNTTSFREALVSALEAAP